MPLEMVNVHRILVRDIIVVIAAILLALWFVYFIRQNPAPSAVRFVPETTIVPEPTGMKPLPADEIQAPSNVPELPADAAPEK